MKRDSESLALGIDDASPSSQAEVANTGAPASSQRRQFVRVVLQAVALPTAYSALGVLVRTCRHTQGWHHAAHGQRSGPHSPRLPGPVPRAAAFAQRRRRNRTWLDGAVPVLRILDQAALPGPGGLWRPQCERHHGHRRAGDAAPGQGQQPARRTGCRTGTDTRGFSVRARHHSVPVLPRTGEPRVIGKIRVDRVTGRRNRPREGQDRRGPAVLPATRPGAEQ